MNLFLRELSSFPEIGEFEWSIFIYNILGEDDAYIEARINISDESLDKGKTLYIFLNKWRTRTSQKVIKSLNDLLKNDLGRTIEEIRQSLIDVDFANELIKGKIKKAYHLLTDIKYIGPTGASKILHMLRPDLFVAWDKTIIEKYGKNETPESYIDFLQEMQSFGKSILAAKEDEVQILSQRITDIYKSRREPLNKANWSVKLEDMVNYLENYGKTLNKLLDEYNWVTFSKGVSLPPSWWPSAKD